MDACDVEQKSLWESSTEQVSHLSGIKTPDCLEINDVLRDNNRPGN